MPLIRMLRLTVSRRRTGIIAIFDGLYLRLTVQRNEALLPGTYLVAPGNHATQPGE